MCDLLADGRIRSGGCSQSQRGRWHAELSQVGQWHQQLGGVPREAALAPLPKLDEFDDLAVVEVGVGQIGDGAVLAGVSLVWRQLPNPSNCGPASSHQKRGAVSEHQLPTQSPFTSADDPPGPNPTAVQTTRVRWSLHPLASNSPPALLPPLLSVSAAAAFHHPTGM